jgi:hypothetical protein
VGELHPLLVGKRNNNNNNNNNKTDSLKYFRTLIVKNKYAKCTTNITNILITWSCAGKKKALKPMGQEVLPHLELPGQLWPGLQNQTLTQTQPKT